MNTYYFNRTVLLVLFIGFFVSVELFGIVETLAPELIAKAPYLKDVKADWTTTEDLDYFNLFPNLNKKDILYQVGFDNRTDYKLVFRKAKKPLFEQANYTITSKGADFFYLNPEDSISIPAHIRDLNEPSIFLYDIYVVPKEGEQGYMLGKVLFGYSCNRVVVNGIAGQDWTDSEKQAFDGLVVNCQEPQGYIKAYVREHHKELFTSWGAFFVDIGHKKIKVLDGSELDLRLWIYYGNVESSTAHVGIGIQKTRAKGSSCIKNGKPGVINDSDACKN